ncbi:hypothetical protein [Mumia zhuanghuii]|nr:hypothetical protein [Mumia zhuanghuii]
MRKLFRVSRRMPQQSKTWRMEFRVMGRLMYRRDDWSQAPLFLFSR